MRDVQIAGKSHPNSNVQEFKKVANTAVYVKTYMQQVGETLLDFNIANGQYWSGKNLANGDNQQPSPPVLTPRMTGRFND